VYFYEIYGMPSMFDAFFILILFFSIPPFHKKSRSLGLQFMTKTSKKSLNIKLKKSKIFTASTIMHERTKNKALYNNKNSCLLKEYLMLIIMVWK
jgi:hypothetical protein